MNMDDFITTLYVTVDDFCKNNLPDDIKPGPKPKLTKSEVITLAMFCQLARFSSEADFYRFALIRLRKAFPNLPNRSQFNRAVRNNADAIIAFFLFMAEQMKAKDCPFEIVDTTAVATRHAKRRGSGWLFGMADIALSKRIGWYEGFNLIIATNPVGVITGFCFAPASVPDQGMAEGLFALRSMDSPKIKSVGAPALGTYIGDKGFIGKDWHIRWLSDYGAELICPNKKNSRYPWPKEWRRWLSGIRQIVETVYDKLHNTFKLSRERPHHISGLWARLAAKVALHNFCIWTNKQLGRPNLAFAELIGW